MLHDEVQPQKKVKIYCSEDDNQTEKPEEERSKEVIDVLEELNKEIAIHQNDKRIFYSIETKCKVH